MMGWQEWDGRLTAPHLITWEEAQSRPTRMLATSHEFTSAIFGIYSQVYELKISYNRRFWKDEDVQSILLKGIWKLSKGGLRVSHREVLSQLVWLRKSTHI